MVVQWLANGRAMVCQWFQCVANGVANHLPIIRQPLASHWPTIARPFANHGQPLCKLARTVVWGGRFASQALRFDFSVFFHLTIWRGFGPPDVTGGIVDMDVALKIRLHSVIGFCAKDGAEKANYANSHMPALHGCKTKIAIGGRRKEQ